MVRRYRERLPLVVVVPSVLISVGTGVTGALVYSDNKGLFNSGSTITLLAGEFLMVFTLPLLLMDEDVTQLSCIAITFLSAFISLGAGLHMFNFSLLDNNFAFPSSNVNLFKSFICLFIGSLLFTGLTLGSITQAYITNWHTEYYEEEGAEVQIEKVESGRYRSNSGSLSLKDKLVSLKASAATLVDTAGRHDDTLASSHTNRSYSYKRSQNNDTIPNYSIKKLSIINQSTSSTNIVNTPSMHHSHSGNTIKSALFTPTLSRFKDTDSSRTMMLERDALKRIPSALLPPHLRSHEKPSSFTHKRDIEPLPVSYSANDISQQYFREPVIQEIPRAATLGTIAPYFKESQGMRTMSLEDYERNLDKIQQAQLQSQMYRPNYPHVFTPPLEESEPEEEGTEEAPPPTECAVDAPQEGANDSTDDAMRYLDYAHDPSATHGDIMKSGMEQTVSSLNLEMLESLAKTNTHSPHKSIFGHSRKGSQLSTKGSCSSLPGSPVRRSRSKRTSPRKLRIKNLSLSSIVYKEDKDEMPNFSYVHELQSSPTKKKFSMDATTPNTTPLKKSKTMGALADVTNTTPDSSCSGKSRTSVFPSEVIGEYDKEKWKTMERLQLVEPAQPADETFWP